MRLQCSPMVKLILFFIQVGPIFFSSYYFFLISVSSVSHSCSHFSALSLSLCSMSLPPSLTKPRSEHKAKLISIAVVYFFFLFSFILFYFIFLVCDLMLNSAVVVWVMDLAFWVVVWCASTILWIWVHGFGFAGLCSWIIDVIGVDRRLDRSHRRGSLRGRERERRRKK